MVIPEHDNESRPTGMELFYVTPIMVGGSLSDPKNKTWLTRAQHIEAVRYWNRIIVEMQIKKI